MPGGNQSKAHTKLVKDVLEAVGSLPYATAWQTNASSPPDPGGRPMRGAPPGSADVLCVVGPMGRFVMLECKTGRAVLNANQTLFQRVVRSFGGIYQVVRSAEEARGIASLVHKGIV